MELTDSSTSVAVPLIICTNVTLARTPGVPTGTPLPGLVQSQPNIEFQSEELVAYEVGYRLRPAKRLSFDVASEREATLIVALEMRKAGGGEGPRSRATPPTPEAPRL